jgi:hypothetical protein
MEAKMNEWEIIESPSDQQQPQEQQMQPAGTLQGLAQSALAGTLGFPGNILDISSRVGKAIGLPEEKGKYKLPTSPEVLQKIESITGRHYEPENIVTKTLERTASNILPALALGPGSPLARVALDLSMSLGSEIGHKLGLPGADLLGAVAGAKLFHSLPAFKGAETLIPRAQALQKEAFTTEKALGSKLPIKKYKYKSQMEDLLNKTKKMSFKDSAQKDWLKDTLQNFVNDADELPMYASKLTERQQEINGLWGNVLGDRNKNAKRILGSAHDIIMKTIDTVGKQQPEWHQSWRQGQELTKALGTANYFQDLLKDVPYLGKKITSGLIYTLFGGGAGAAALKGLPVAGLGLAGVAVAPQAAKTYGFLTSGETPRRLYWEATKQLAERNFPAAAKTILKLDKEAKKYEKDMANDEWELI